MSIGADKLRELILEIVPKDGTPIGNKALFEALRKQHGDVSESAFENARDALIVDGELEKGRGRGGSVYLLLDKLDSEEEETDEDFELEAQEETATAKRAPKTKGKPRKRKSIAGAPQIVSYRYPDKRINNPEVGMVHPENDPDQPRTVWKFDPHLDPALQFDSARSHVENLIDGALASGDANRMGDALTELKRLQAPYLKWTGKAERTSFAVDTVSLHVHERIDPASVLAAVRKRIKNEKEGRSQLYQPGLFEAPFESLPLRQAVDFYKHEKNWSNRLISGDSVLVMNSLLQKESMAGQVQMIYIDPPYGIKYGSNFQPFTNKRDVKDGADADLTQEPEMIKAFRDTWELGIHSYLTYLRDRLLLARELLSETGSLFVQISDENLHFVRNVLDEVFGVDNFISQITFKTGSGFNARYLKTTSDYLLWYSKSKDQVKFRRLYSSKAQGEESYFDKRQLKNGRIVDAAYQVPENEVAEPIALRPFVSSFSQNTNFEYEYQGKAYYCGENRSWKTTPVGMDRVARVQRIDAAENTLKFVARHTDLPVQEVTHVWDDTMELLRKSYAVQTTTKVLERCILMTTDPGDLVFDPTCGSGTTAFVAEKCGRRWMTCDTSRVAVTLAKQRLMTASFDYYALRYPHEGLKGGFIYKTVPHVTLKSIANNPDIDVIYERFHPAIEKALGRLNLALRDTPDFVPPAGVRKGTKITIGKGAALFEWEVPFELPAAWPGDAAAPFEEFHAARGAMQRAMEEVVAGRAELETLYDKPEPDASKLRITGPFSVEAVPNPTVLSLEQAHSAPNPDASIARSGETSRQALWRDELIKAGVRGKGGQKLKFAELEPVPGLRNLHATGALADTGERVVVSFGPEHAALEQRQVELALTEAEKLRPSAKFVVFCAFTFDPEAAKDIDEVSWPGVTMLRVQMNTDLLTEDLKKARASNESFWLMGQPDVELRALSDGRWQVEVHGFDYFDTKKGELVSGGKSKIAMWSIDPDYDQRSLFPHQVFFPIAGKKEGWHRLRKTLRAELDEDLLDQFHGTVSLPFEAGENQCVAVKIVDDRGIESLKVIPLNR